MKPDRSRLTQAKKHLRQLEDQIQRFADQHPELTQRQVDNDPRLKRLFQMADNAERVVQQLEVKTRKRR
jgi:hypothetical protein